MREVMGQLSQWLLTDWKSMEQLVGSSEKKLVFCSGYSTMRILFFEIYKRGI